MLFSSVEQNKHGRLVTYLFRWQYYRGSLQRISPGPPTSRHSTRRDNSTSTFSAGWKGQVSLHPSSLLSTGAPLRVCWPPASLSGMGTAVLLTDRKTLQRTVNTAAKIIGAPLPSILDIYIYIYIFSRHFYPKRLTLHSSYSFFTFDQSFDFPYTMLQQGLQHREGPHPSLTQPLPAPAIR